MLRHFRSRLLARVTLFVLLGQVLPIGSHGDVPTRGVPPAAVRAFRVVFAQTRRGIPGKTVRVRLPNLSRSRLYSVSVSVDPAVYVKSPALPAVSVALSTADQSIGGKKLHAGDPDLYALIRPTRDGEGQVAIRGAAGVPVAIKVVEWNVDADRVRIIAYKPNGSWRQAVPMTLGETVFGSGDLAPYVPTKVEETTRYYDAAKKAAGLTAEARADAAEDWLVFRHDEETPRLVYFQLDLPERDDIPPDISVYVEKNGKLEPYENGADPVTAPHEVQALPGNKFTTRTITKGAYYVRVLANHPEWQLRTQVLPAPPYDDPRQAVRTGVDYLLGAGDSWHANTPRAGARLNRVGNVHAETAQCIACHPTQFTTRAAQTALENGYAVQRREALRFLVERMANNPRPLPGHKTANWVRMISAPGNVTGRMADLVATQGELTGDKERGDVHRGAYHYLKLYYKSRTTLPDDETNGNQPLVSQYEVLYHAWRVFEREARRPGGDPEARSYAARVLTLLEQNRHRNLIDLCWQTIAMVKSDRTRFARQIAANCERLLALQRPDGQWSKELDPDSAAVEFQTGHALYTLAAAGYKTDHPQVRKAVRFLLGRQQPFGGWFDPLQSYENFRTPFRETQFAVMALSQLYPAGKPPSSGPPTVGVGRGKNGALTLSDPVALLMQLDALWTTPPPAVLAQIVALLKSDEPLVRQMAAQALGRVGDARAVPALVAALGDRTKMVQRTAAVALRQLGNRGIGIDAIRAALGSPNDRTRWGATRIFAHHSRALAARRDLADALLKRTADASLPIRVDALQALWQWYQWTGDDALRERMLDRILARLAASEHPWVVRNARESLYNIADENVRYLYNNWIPALGEEADRKAAAEGQQARDALVARKLAAALAAGNGRLRKSVLRALAEFHLRSVREQSGRYARIGNDVEQIRFAPEAARILEPAIARAMQDPSPDVRRWAIIAAFTLRDSGPLPVAATLLARLNDPNPDVRAAAAEFQRAIPLDMGGKDAARTTVALLESSHPPARQAALRLLQSREGAALAEAPGVRAAVRVFVREATGESLPAALALVAAFPDLQQDEGVRGIVRTALGQDDWQIKRAALELALTSRAIGQSAGVDASVSALFEDRSPVVQKALLELARSAPATRTDPRMISALSDALLSPDDDRRGIALELVQKDAALRRAPAVQAALQELTTGANARLAQIAASLTAGKTGSGAADTALDYAFFARRVMPVFARKSGSDGAACVSCHFNHNLFKATPPDADGRFTNEQVRETYRAALKMVNLQEPTKSLLLLKPLSSSASEGVVNAATVAHGGGQRWSGPDDPDYRTVLAWLNGARLEETADPKSGSTGRESDLAPDPISHAAILPFRRMLRIGFER